MLTPKEELDVFEVEGAMIYAPLSLEIFSWPEEEEESNQGKITDDPMTLVAGLVGLVEGLYYGYWNGADLGRKMVLLSVGGNLVPQTKVEVAQIVVPRVVVPHACKYMAD